MSSKESVCLIQRDPNDSSPDEACVIAVIDNGIKAQVANEETDDGHGNCKNSVSNEGANGDNLSPDVIGVLLRVVSSAEPEIERVEGNAKNVGEKGEKQEGAEDVVQSTETI